MKDISQFEYFSFRKFRVRQDGVTWKVGTDSILLGAWASVAGLGQVLDVGTGTGLLSLMCAQRSVTANILAVELDQRTADIARSNFDNSPWSGRLSLICADINQYEVEPGSCDMIISNPPYFPEGIIPEDKRRKKARTGDGFGPVQLPAIAAAALGEDGILSTIVPVALTDEFVETATQSGLHMHRRTDVRHSADHGTTRSLLEFGIKPGPTVLNELSLYLSSGALSESHRDLISEFREV